MRVVFLCLFGVRFARQSGERENDGYGHLMAFRGLTRHTKDIYPSNCYGPTLAVSGNGEGDREVKRKREGKQDRRG